MSLVNLDRVGYGLAFPMLSSNSKPMENDGLARINSSLLQLFETPKGSRLYLPDYGVDLRQFRFEPNDTILRESIRAVLTNDIPKWEPRITVVSVDFYADDNAINNYTLYISVQYRVKSSDQLGTFVYPYSLEPYDSVDYDTV